MADRHFDVLIIGAGLGGISLALRLAETGVRVGLVAKKPLDECSSHWAQGGIAAAVGPDDSPEKHAADTKIAGAGLCRSGTVDFVVERAPTAIRWLADRGVAFTMANGHLDLHREGGHSVRRVVHHADDTGRAVMDVLRERLREASAVTLLEDHFAIDLITAKKFGLSSDGRGGSGSGSVAPAHEAAAGASDRDRCLGAYALDNAAGRVVTLAADTVVLASGGASKVYLYTSNPDTSTGDGIAMAWRAGCRVANLEFVQFHPTCLYHPKAKSLLISEAVRGEGALLRLPDGHRFMPDHDDRAELASRDVVARATDYEMKRGGFDSVYLDITHKPAAEVLEHFPNIAASCREFGFDITTEPVPVVPAAHYSCGGVVTDLEAKTDLPGLYAVGECTFTGLHGANRLASNSLLECMVFAEAAFESILADIGGASDRALRAAERPALPAWDESQVTDPDEMIVVSHNWDELRRLMWDYVGIVRTNKRLERARRRVELLREEIAEFYGHFIVNSDLIELRNLTLVADLTIRSALARHESRGLHFNRDYPETLPAEEARDTILVPQ